MLAPFFFSYRPSSPDSFVMASSLPVTPLDFRNNSVQWASQSNPTSDTSYPVLRDERQGLDWQSDLLHIFQQVTTRLDRYHTD
jgi:hypothetical protein